MAANDYKHITVKTLRYYHEKLMSEITTEVNTQLVEKMSTEGDELHTAVGNIVESVVEEKFKWTSTLPEE